MKKEISNIAWANAEGMEQMSVFVSSKTKSFSVKRGDSFTHFVLMRITDNFKATQHLFEKVHSWNWDYNALSLTNRHLKTWISWDLHFPDIPDQLFFGLPGSDNAVGRSSAHQHEALDGWPTSSTPRTCYHLTDAPHPEGKMSSADAHPFAHHCGRSSPGSRWTR